MAKIRVTYFDLDDVEMTCVVNADDESAALGCVLDLYGDNILADSPFAVWREHAPRRKSAGGRRGAKAKLITEPVPVEADPEMDDLNPLMALDETDEPPPAVKKLLEEVSGATGVRVGVKA